MWREIMKTENKLSLEILLIIGGIWLGTLHLFLSALPADESKILQACKNIGAYTFSNGKSIKCSVGVSNEK